MALTKEQLVALTPTERMDTKATEIAKFDLAGTYVDKTYGVEIEVVSVSKIDKGVEVLARAWKDGKQLGFGPKGLIDIERFRIINPPTSVPDGTFTTKTYEGKEYQEENYKIDPEAALKQAVASIASQVGKDGRSIMKNLVGSTVTTVYASYSAMIWWAGSGTWSAARDAAIGSAVDTTDDRWVIRIDQGSVPNSNKYLLLSRTGFTFDTSAIPDTDTISSAVLSIYGASLTNSNDDGQDIRANVYSFSPANPASYATADYDQFGTTAFSTAIAYGSWSTSAYNDFTLNSSGISNISKTGNSVFGVRESQFDAANSAMADTVENAVHRQGFRQYTASGTANDPKLVITHSSEAPNTTSFFPFLDRR